MSLLLPNNLYFTVSPERVSFVQLSRWSQKILRQASLDCAVAELDTLTTAQSISQPKALANPIAQPLALLAQLLAQHVQLAQSAHCHVVLANCFVRQLVMPPLSEGLSDQELNVLAKHYFLETYGSKAEHWQIQVDAIHHVASAIDVAIIEQLRAVCTRYGCQLRSVESQLSHAFNQTRLQLGQQLACLVQVEQSHLTIALIDKTRWLRLTALPYQGDWAQQLPAIIKREVLLAGLVLEQVNLYVQHVPHAHAPQANGVKDSPLQQATPQQNASEYWRNAAFVPNHQLLKPKQALLQPQPDTLLVHAKSSNASSNQASSNQAVLR